MVALAARPALCLLECITTILPAILPPLQIRAREQHSVKVRQLRARLCLACHEESRGPLCLKPPGPYPITNCTESCTAVANYTFTPGKLSSGGDIGVQQLGKNAVQLAAQCSLNPGCKGFTSSGWLKSTVKHPVLWTTWNTTSALSPCDGMFVKAGYGFASE